MPACDSVKAVNTPVAYSGIRASTLPRLTTSQHGGEHAQNNNAVAENEAVSQFVELLGQEAVAGQNGRQARKVGEAGIGGKHQNGGGEELRNQVQNAHAAGFAEYRAGNLVNYGAGRRRKYTTCRWVASRETPINSVPKMMPIASRVWAAFLDLGS